MSVSTISAPNQVAPSAYDGSNETTRYLSAAVHLDDHLADALVREYLVEPLRAVPPSPGVRAERVLREAVGAQMRRYLLDAGLLCVVAAMALLSFSLVFMWFVSGLVWRLAAAAVDLIDRDKPGRTRKLKPWQRWWMTVLLWFVPGGLIGGSIGLASVVAGNDEPWLPGASASDSAVLRFLLAVGLTVLIYTALVVYGYTRRWTADAAFGYGAYNPDAAPRRFVAWACGRFAGRLHRIAIDDSRHRMSAEVVVYRGRNPFVGAGKRVQSWSIALELRQANPTTPDVAVPPFRPSELHDFIAADMESLRAAHTLTPGARFTNLEIVDWATLSARHMVHYPAAVPLLGHLHSGMNPTLTQQDWVDLRECSPEWLRYFRCYRLEAWERQLVVSGFLHIGCTDRTLYLEWTGCVLPPVAAAYRSIDEPPPMANLGVFWSALTELAQLGYTAFGRALGLVRGVLDYRGIGHGNWRTPAGAGWVYGAEQSLREITAGDSLTNYFEEADSDQYLKIMERRVLDAVHRFLTAKGISTSKFDGLATRIDNSTVLNHCTVIAGNIGGHDNVGQANPTGFTG